MTDLDRYITGNYGEDQFKGADDRIEQLLAMIVGLQVYGPEDSRNQGNVERAKAIAREVLKELGHEIV